MGTVILLWRQGNYRMFPLDYTFTQKIVAFWMRSLKFAPLRTGSCSSDCLSELLLGRRKGELVSCSVNKGHSLVMKGNTIFYLIK